MKAVDHKCPNCNAVLKYNPKNKNWKCEYCGSSFTLEELKKKKKKYKETKVEEKEESDTDLDEYYCDNCGEKKKKKRV